MLERTHEHKPSSPWERLWRTVQLAVQWLSIVLDHAKPIRVTLLVLVIGAVAAVAVDQAAELFLIAVWIDPDVTRYVSLLLTVALASVAIWYSTRQAYRLVYLRWPALQEPRAEWLRRWLPYALGMLLPVIVLLGYLAALHGVDHENCGTAAMCHRRVWRTSGLWIEAIAPLFAMAWARRQASTRRHNPLANSESATPRVQKMQHLGRAPLTIFVSVLLLNVLTTALIVWQPRLLDGIGPLAILLIAAAFMCTSGGFLCMLADRRGLPLLSLLLLLAVLMHALHWNDNHHVRQYASMKTYAQPTASPAENRPSFDAYAHAWLESRCDRSRACPVIVVSSEGGGMRSAAWTAIVLNRLANQVDAQQIGGDSSLFARYLFAGSGVSGGSLGLATYVTQLHASDSHIGDKEPAIRDVLGHDFLAPMLANMFFVDFTQRWLPFAWFDDRSRALTRAWELAANRQHIDAFNAPFSALYEHADGSVDATLPALFFNSTTVAQGWRLVQHPFRPFDNAPWVSAFDGSAWLDPRVPLSEAVLNSARFTYLSPAGTLLVTPHSGASLPVPVSLQLVDGGYFENSGTTTLREVMQRLNAVAAQRGQTLHYIVLHISNDPTLSDFVDAHDRTHPLPLYSPICPNQANAHVLPPNGEVTAPIKALLNTRDARGEYARTQLLDQLRMDQHDAANGDVLWHMRLCPGDYPLPLGWTISEPVFDEMDRQLAQNYPLDTMAKWLHAQLSHARP